MYHIIGVHECVCVRGEGEWVWALGEWVMSRRSMSHVTYTNVSYYGTWMCMRERGGLWFRALDEGVRSLINESCHIYEYVILHVYMNVYAWEGGGECVWALDECVMSHINESCHTYECVIWYVYMNVYVWEGGTSVSECSVNESCHTSMSHVTYMNVSHYRCTWMCMRERGGRVCLSARWMSHVTHINESCHIYEYVILQLYMNVYAWEGRGGVGLSARWMSHVTHQWVMSHTWMCHIIGVPESVCVTGRGRVCLSARWMSHVTQINESCHTYECVTLMVYMNVYAWEGRASWFEHSMNASCHVDQWVMSHIWMCHITRVHECVCVILGGDWVWALDEWVMSHINESCHIYECVTL